MSTDKAENEVDKEPAVKPNDKETEGLATESTEKKENESSAPILKKKISTAQVTKKSSSSEIKKKLRNILDGVALQESDLKRKTHKIEEWFNLHREALVTASNTKQKLTEFEIINDNDDEDIKAAKTNNKKEINNNLDKLEKQLKKINLTEKKYRSRESIQENNELSETIKKLQNKYKILSKKYNQQASDLDKLTKQNQENEIKIKTLIESNKKSLETTKKQIESKHKNYIQNLQSQHENLLKKQKEENINTYQQNIDELKNQIAKIKKDDCDEMESKLNTLKMEKEMENSKLLNEYNIIENKFIEKEEELSEYKLRETAHKELMLKWQAQKEKKNEKIISLSQNVETLTNKIENIEQNNQKLQERTALNSVQITQKDGLYSELENKYKILCETRIQLDKDKKLLEAKLKVSIKEIIKLRQATKNKDANKTVLLTEMSNLEIDKNKKINTLNNNIDALNNEILLLNKEFLKQFESLNINLNDVHSKLESFSVTIRNFSGNSLKQSYATELEARKKSNQELPAWQDNIREQVRKNTEQITINMVNINIINNDDNKQEKQTAEKIRKIIKESETQISHIKLTGLHLLDEYTSLLMAYNHLYISQDSNNRSNNNHKDKNDKHSSNKNIFTRRKSSNKTNPKSNK